MGTWDAGPFDNDDAAAFCGTLDESPPDERAGLLQDALQRVLDIQGDVPCDDAAETVAAAALVASQCPGGPALGPGGPGAPLPQLPAGLPKLAVQALDRVTSEPSELLSMWGGTDSHSPWHGVVHSLREVLDRHR